MNKEDLENPIVSRAKNILWAAVRSGDGVYGVECDGNTLFLRVRKRLAGAPDEIEFSFGGEDYVFPVVQEVIY